MAAAADPAALAELREKLAEVRALEARLFPAHSEPGGGAGRRGEAAAEAGAGGGGVTPRVKTEVVEEAGVGAGAGADAGAGAGAGAGAEMGAGASAGAGAGADAGAGACAGAEAGAEASAGAGAGADAGAGAEVGADAGAGAGAGDTEDAAFIGFPGFERAPGSAPCSAAAAAAVGGGAAAAAPDAARGVEGEQTGGVGEELGAEAADAGVAAATRKRGGDADEDAPFVVSPALPPARKRRKGRAPAIPRDHENVARWKLIDSERKKVRVCVRSFKGNVGVDIREFYEKAGKEMSAKKGYWLPAEGWPALKAAVDGIDAELETLRRAK